MQTADDGKQIKMAWTSETLENPVNCNNMAMKSQEEIHFVHKDYA